jgi:hypothetical protein
LHSDTNKKSSGWYIRNQFQTIVPIDVHFSDLFLKAAQDRALPRW